MVNFGQKLRDNIREQWREYYIDYNRLKKLLKRQKKDAGAAEPGSDSDDNGSVSTFRRDASAPLLPKSASGGGGGAATTTTTTTTTNLSAPTTKPPRLPKKPALKHPAASSLTDSQRSIDASGNSGGGGGSGYSRGGSSGSDEDKKLIDVSHVISRYDSLTQLKEPDDTGPVSASGGVHMPAARHAVARTHSLSLTPTPTPPLQHTIKLSSAPALSGDMESAESPQPTDFHTMFKEEVLRELGKVEKFYRTKVDDLQQQLSELKSQLRMMPELGGIVSSPGRVKVQVGPRERDSVEKTLMRLNREMALLQNFCILNYTGFVKILKKHDKLSRHRKLTPEVLPFVEGTEFFHKQALDALVAEVTDLFAVLFCNGDRNQASALMLPKRSTAVYDWFLLSLGYRLGVAATLAVWVVWDCVVQVAKFGKPTVVAKLAFPVYRAVGGLLLLHWCWGLVEWACDSLRINYVYLLDLNPKHVSSPRRIFDHAVNQTIVYLTSMLLYYKVLVGGFPGWLPAGFYPLLLFIYTIHSLLMPLRQRAGLWVTLGRVIISPLKPVTLLDTLVADMLTSLVKVLLDIVWSLFYFFSGDFLQDTRQADLEGIPLGLWQHNFWYNKILAPLVVISPLWWRFMQCLRRYHDTGNRWPHLANALKYAITQMVTLFGAFHHVYYQHYTNDNRQHGNYVFDVIWVIITVMSTVYSYSWDVLIDWGLGRPEKRFLNDRRMYHSAVPYYIAVFLDLFLRFVWVNTLIPPGSGGLISLPLYMNAALLVLEILRRSGWAVLRLENEHLRNTQGFRRVDVIPLAFQTEAAHEYKEPHRFNKIKVLLEVALVATVVISLSIGAVVAAAGIDRAATHNS